MRFNSIASEEPYQGLKFWMKAFRKVGPLSRTSSTGIARLSSARALRCSLKWGNERNPYRQLPCVWRNCPALCAGGAKELKVKSRKFVKCFKTFNFINFLLLCLLREQRAGRKEGMTSNQRDPLMPWATLMLQWSGQWAANP